MSDSSAPAGVPIEALLAHRDWVRALARTLVADRADADDVEQEAWRRALERPPRHAGSLRAWLAQVVRNVARGRSRSERRRSRRDAGCAAPRDVRSAPDLVAETELHQRLVAEVLALEEPARSTVLRRWFEGRSVAEIAAEDGLPADTVKTRLRRAHLRLRERLPEEDRNAWAVLLLPSATALSWPAAIVAAAVAGAALVGVAALVRGHDPADLSSAGPAAVAASPPTDGGDARGGRARARTEPTAPEPDTARAVPAARGIVVRKDGGAPVADAQVDLHDDPWEAHGIRIGPLDPGPVRASATTDAQGAFAIPSPGGTRGVLVASAEGLGAAALEWTAQAPVRFELAAAGPAAVHVVRAEDRVPIEGARVLHVDRGHGRFPVREARTDASGTASLPSTPVDATLLVFAPRRRVTTGRASGTIALGPAEEVAGAVVDDEGAPVPGARVVAVCVPMMWSAATRTDAAGRFGIDGFGREDARQITASADGHHPASLVFAGSDTSVRLVLPRLGALGGRVVGPDGEPVAGARVEFLPERGAVAETVSDAGGNFAFRAARAGGGALRASAGELADAQYALGPALVGACSVSANRDDGPPTIRLTASEVSFVRVAAADAAGRRLALAEVRAERLVAAYEEEDERLLVVAAPPGTTVAARVTALLEDRWLPPLLTTLRTGARDAPATLVTFPVCPLLRVDLRTPDGRELPPRSAVELRLRVVTDTGLRAVNEEPDSEIRTRICAERSYVLEAWAAAGGTILVGRREFRGADVVEAPLAVRLAPAPGLLGRLVREDGVPVAVGSVSGDADRARVAADGSFTLRCRTTGTIDLTYYDGRSKLDLPLGRFAVPPEGDADLGEVALPRVVDVRGRVVHADGTPAGGAAVRFARGGGPDGRTFPTAADGTFALVVSDRERGAVVASKAGHGTAWRVVDDVAATASSPDPFELRLAAEGSVRVRVPFCNPECGETRGTIVRTADGRVAWRADSADHRLVPGGEAWTFVVDRLPPGAAVVEVLGRERDWVFDAEVAPGAVVDARLR